MTDSLRIRTAVLVMVARGMVARQPGGEGWAVVDPTTKRHGPRPWSAETVRVLADMQAGGFIVTTPSGTSVTDRGVQLLWSLLAPWQASQVFRDAQPRT